MTTEFGGTSPPLPVPPPAVPVPVLPLPAGDVGEALARHYAAKSRPQRPGVITAIGFTSIVVACVSIVMSMVLAVQAYAMYMATVLIGSAAVARPPGAPPTAVAPVVVAEVDGALAAAPAGLTAEQRGALGDGLAARQPLTQSQRRQLDAILAASGRELGLENVTESGTMPPDRSGLPGPEYFVTDKGRLEIYPDRAVFFPLSGARVLRVSAPPPEPDSPIPGGMGPRATGPGALSAAEVKSLIQHAQQLSFNRLNPAQVRALEGILTTPGQTWAKPGQSPPAITYAGVNPDGSAAIRFGNVGIALGRDGRHVGGFSAFGEPPTPGLPKVGPPVPPEEVAAIVQQVRALGGNKLTATQAGALRAQLILPGQALVTAGQGAGAVTRVDVPADGSVAIHFVNGRLDLGPQGELLQLWSNPTPAFIPAPTMNLEAMSLLVVSVILSLTLAVLLLCAGIMALRQSPRSRRLHLLYAAVKIPVAVASGIAVAWMIESFSTGVSSTGQGAGGLAAWWGLGPAVVACVYPLALLIVLNLGRVREYFSAARMG